MGGELRIWASNYDLPNLDDQLHHLTSVTDDGPGCEMMEGYAISTLGPVKQFSEDDRKMK
jgi:hypothetical protein